MIGLPATEFLLEVWSRLRITLDNPFQIWYLSQLIGSAVMRSNAFMTLTNVKREFHEATLRHYHLSCSFLAIFL